MSNRDDRLVQILRILKKHPRISVKRLIDLTSESISTMRRDLIILEQSGRIKRTFGMVSLLQDTNIEFASPFRRREHIAEKKVICRLLAKVIQDNQAMFIDSSTTAAHLPNYLMDYQNLNIITNNLQFTVAANSMTNLNVFLTGGQLRANSDSILGSHTLQDIAMFRPQLAIMSCSTLDISGAYMADVEQATIKRQMVENARESILLADHTKFRHDNSDYIKLAELSAWSILITDKKPDKLFIEKMKINDVRVMFPGS
ncbi:DeoR/GlpR transcriptional regulator [Lactobacillus sp. CBA3606]|uniref:DeoR/GlpR family DNA-binding transcription regulator n=1 Tax=Lactobacillus sp. CBA3606 TaxID=2099789 RepID=UPI000CFA90A1|nr:DeoR/GlpR family DNA-binding transcription regulator [Lactobacillus sp. CBA3606]AVK64032.1 DeoR/GlpR transcriptional regulator [Lactobacillus sp. CBA3606]